MVIFGGSSGIGLATAVHAAEQGAARIRIIGRNQERLDTAVSVIQAAASASSIVTSASVDVTDEAKVIEFVNTIEDRSVDHMVTTPGGSARLGNLVANKRNCDDVRRQFNLKYFAQVGWHAHATKFYIMMLCTHCS